MVCIFQGLQSYVGRAIAVTYCNLSRPGGRREAKRLAKARLVQEDLSGLIVETVVDSTELMMSGGLVEDSDREPDTDEGDSGLVRDSVRK